MCMCEIEVVLEKSLNLLKAFLAKLRLIQRRGSEKPD